MTTYSTLRAAGRLHGTIKRATALHKSRLAARDYTDPLITAKQSRPSRAAALRVSKSDAAIPTRREAVSLADEVLSSLASVEGRCTQRCLSGQAVILCGRTPGDRRNGGRPANSYGYSYTLTSARSYRDPGGLVTVHLVRSSRTTDPADETISAPAGHWRRITLDSTILAGGGYVAIKVQHSGRDLAGRWDVLDKTGRKVGVAIRVSDDRVASRWSRWEHGRTLAEAQAEMARKVSLLDAEDRQRAEDQATAARRDRAAKILAKIGSRTLIGALQARAAGACQSGIAAFAARIGRSPDDQISLTELSQYEPTWAVKIARTLIS